MEYREVLGRTGELVKEENEIYNRAGKGGLSAREQERLGQLEVKPGPVLGPSQAVLDAQRNRLRPRRGKGKGREDRQGLAAVAPQPGCGVSGRSGTRRLVSAPRTHHMARWKRRRARSPVANRACGHFER